MLAPKSPGSGKNIGRAPQWRWFGCLAGLAIVAYLPIWRAGFIWDDDSMLTDNRLIKAGDGLYRFWCTTLPPDYWPLTSTTLWIEWRLWGPNALGYHLTNLFLHIAAAGLLGWILQRLRMPGAWWAALWFSVHPINVESVVWIAQRKNLLAMLFYLASIACFLRTDILAEPEKPRSFASGWYWLSLLAFFLAMLSKGSVAVLPVMLVGLILWHRRPNLADARRLALFFAVAAILAGVDVWFQQHGAPGAIRTAGFLERLLGAGGVVWFYLFKSVWPAALVFVYPQWRIDPANPAWWLPLAGVVAVTGILRFARRARPACFAWGYFCVALLPVLGFTDVYFMKYSLVADHYAHLALIGVVAWAGFAGTRLYQRGGKIARPALAGLACLATGLLAGGTWNRSRIYRDNLTLFRATEAHNPGSWMVHTSLGRAWSQIPGRLNDSIAEYQTALRLKPDSALAHDNLGDAWIRTPGRLNDAISEYRAALRLEPDFAAAHNNLGNALAEMPGRLNDAIAQYREALRLEPDFAEAHNNLGYTWLSAHGPLDDSIGEFRAALRLEPDFVLARINLAVALLNSPGGRNEALAQLHEVLRLEPANGRARQILEKIRVPQS